MPNKYIFTAAILLNLGTAAIAACSYDHFLIGRNPDGIEGTGDDMKLYIDVTQKYRHSDPDQTGAESWRNWYYPMTFSPIYNRWQVSEPGFDLIRDGSGRQLIGQANVNYRLYIECSDISPGLKAYNANPAVNLTQPGDAFCHSCAADPHVHVQYRLSAAADANEPYWITYRIYDDLGMYHPSDAVTVVFLNPTLDGDLTVDRLVDIQDAAAFFERWLAFSDCALFTGQGKAALDLFERADINRDYAVDLADFAWLAYNWARGTDTADY
jgi:hypothetical protein